MTKTSHLPLEPAWDQPSSWLHRKPMQTGLATVISVQRTSTGGRCAKGQKSDKLCVLSRLIVFVDMLLSCFRVCLFRVVFLLPCGCKFGSSRTHGRVEPPHDTVQDHCEASAFCVSSLAMAVWTTHIAHYCAISKSPQCLPLIDSLIKTSLVMCWLPKCTKNVACLPTTRMIKDEENWEKIENWLQGVTSCIVVHATTTVVYGTVVIVMVVVIVIVHVMVAVVLSAPGVVVTAIVSSSSSPPHPCKDMDARDPRKSAASVPVMTWISFKKHWNAMHTFFEISNFMYLCHPNLKHNFVVNNPGFTAPQRMMATAKHTSNSRASWGRNFQGDLFDSQRKNLLIECLWAPVQPFHPVVVFGGGWLCFRGADVIAVVGCAVMWCGMMSSRAMWCDVNGMWCHVSSCDVLSCDVMWCHVKWCDAMGRDGLGWDGCYVVVLRCMWLAVR